MATTADIRNGLCIEMNNDLFSIVEFLHVKPGKGPAFVRTKLKNLKTGKVIPHTFTSGVRLDVARIERRQHQFLYKDDMGLHFMNMESYDQIPIAETMIENSDLLKEGQEVDIIFHADTETPLTCEMPAFVVMKITYAEPGVKGDTASSNVTKPATIETGATIHVPLFINEGDIIKVDTRTRSYSERVNK